VRLAGNSERPLRTDGWGIWCWARFRFIGDERLVNDCLWSRDHGGDRARAGGAPWAGDRGRRGLHLVRRVLRVVDCAEADDRRGDISAKGGDNGAGIGTATGSGWVFSVVDELSISGGNVSAEGGQVSAGIGSGSAVVANCTTKVTAMRITGGNLSAQGATTRRASGREVRRTAGSCRVRGQ
jgi:hypothetical protein